jgi:hypothetical protein
VIGGAGPLASVGWDVARLGLVGAQAMACRQATLLEENHFRFVEMGWKVKVAKDVLELANLVADLLWLPSSADLLGDERVARALLITFPIGDIDHAESNTLTEFTDTSA